MISVLFTDLVDSTRLLSELGIEAAEGLRRDHFALLRSATHEYAGTEIKNLGDGLMVVFGSAREALASAVAMQQRVERANRSTGVELGLRVGLAAGDAEAEGGDYFGRPVVEASRLCALAAAGEILATDVVRALAGGQSGFKFTDRGSTLLKGLDDPVGTCAAVWAPLARDASSVPMPRQLIRELDIAFVGRDVERELVADTVKQATSAQRRGVVMIGGEPGIGKTTLSVEAARSAFDLGATVLYGRCDEDLGVPYQPWIEALGHLIEHAADTLVDEYVGDYGGELARLVPELARRRPEYAPSEADDPESERYLLFEAVRGLLRIAGDDAPVLIVLDDLHWSDKPTLLLLRHLIRSSDPMRLVVIGTFRESEVPAGHPLADLLAALHREDGIARVSLLGLSDVELLDLMATTAGHAMGADGVELAHALRRETDGNPFFVAEILRHLAETGAIFQRDGRWVASADLRDSGLPVSVREVIGRRIARLGEPTARVLGIAAVIGREFDTAIVAQIAQMDEDTLIDLVDQAVSATLVEEVRGTPGRYSFVHALIEHTLYDGLSASRRARTHRQVAEVLESVYGTEESTRVGELAYHWVQATVPQEVLKTIDYTRRAAERALDQLAPDEALRWYAQSLELCENARVDDERLRCELLVGLGDAQRQSGVPGSRETLLDAAHLAQHLGAGDLLVRAVLVNSRGMPSDIRRMDTERLAVLQTALDAAPNERDRARLLALLATETVFGGEYQTRRALSDEALTLARSSGDAATLAFVLSQRLVALWAPETVDERTSILEEFEALARGLDDPVLESRIRANRHLLSIELGDTQASRRALFRQAEIAERFEVVGASWSRMWSECLLALLSGDVETAERLADENLALGTQIGEPDALQYYAGMLIAVRWHQGRLAELEPLIAQVAADTPGVPAFIAELAHSRCEKGDDESARTLLNAAAADHFATVPYDGVWTTTLAVWSEVAAHLEATDAADPLVELLNRDRDHVVFNGVTTFGPTADFLGMLETILGHFDAAEAHFDRAMAIHERFQAPFFLGRTYLHHAELCARRNRPGDAEHARVLLADVLTIANAHGYAGLRRQAETLN
jgi:class 3 adenylate cyclase